MPPENVHHFDIHSSVVFQLGESLISDVVQALVELIKNAYDADADFAKVTIETMAENNVEGSNYRGAKGYISIEDNGFGMDESTVKRGWLTISNSLKRDMKTTHKVTPKGRTPLGDKGLGRLGAQRLGYNLEVFTRLENSDKEYHVAFSWNDFRQYATLSEVPIYFETEVSAKKAGTTLLISEIRDAASWKGKVAIDRLQDQLSQMIIPFKDMQSFDVIVSIDGRRIELAELTERILNTAQIRYLLKFDKGVFSVRGKVRLNFFRPENKEDKPRFRELVEKDQGQEFLDFLSTKPKAGKFRLEKAEEEGWFIEYEFVRPFKDMDSLEKIDGKLANPGPFAGEIDSFDLGSESIRQQNVFDTASEYKRYIKGLNGIRVYRDGFGIRLDRDWLGLGKQWTTATSYYGLKPENTVGYIALSARDNFVLEETTDREGFKVSPYYTNFLEILNQFIRFSLEAQQFFRRGWIEFRNANMERVANVEAGTSPEDLTDRIVDGLSKAKKYQRPLMEIKDTLNKTELDAQHVADNAQRRSAMDSATIQEVQAATRGLLQSIEEAKGTISLLDGYIQELSHLESVGEVLKNQVDQLRQQLAETYETVSLGLTAEALSHEIHNVADRLAKEAETVRYYVLRERSKDAKLVSFIEHVASAVSALHKQLSHLTPSLKYLREKREGIELSVFFAEQNEYYQPRFQNNNIEVKTSYEDSKDFAVYMNRGKLTQIIDNIFLNSEYWLREDMRMGVINKGSISVIINKPFVRISDNGRGVDPSVETTLFEPFVTMKGKEKGRGLGLFIVQQLLDSEGCSISLLPERNINNRRYIFELNLTGGLNDNRQQE